MNSTHHRAAAVGGARESDCCEERKSGHRGTIELRVAGAGGGSSRHFGAKPAAELLPEAAAANRSVFYDPQSGAPRTVSDIYRSLAARVRASFPKHRDAVEDGVGKQRDDHLQPRQRD